MEKLHNTVYKKTNIINNHFYIGVHCTNNLNDNYLGSGTVLHRAYKKYGVENFTTEILYDVDTAELAYFIEELIVNEDFIAREDTYNIHIGGTGGWKNAIKTGFKHSEETKEKMSNSRIGLIPWNKGIPMTEEVKNKLRLFKHSEETKNKMSESKKGRKLSKEHKQKISESLKNVEFTEERKQNISTSLKGNVPWNKGLKNCYTEEFLNKIRKPRSEETKKKISEALKGKKYKKSIL